MSGLLDAASGKPSTLPDEKSIQQAVLSGTHTYAPDAQINVVSPDGESGAISGADLQRALKQGYRLETAKEGALKDYVADNDNLGGAAKVALGKFGSELLLGIPELIHQKTANPDDVAKWEALKESHPAASFAGGAGGFLGSLAVGGPLFKGASKAGEVAAKGTAQALESYGLKRGSESLAKDLVARSIEKAAALGTEGVVISAPRALTEAALGDPEAAAESLLMGGGIGAVLGGLIAGPGSKVLDTLKARSAKAAEKAATLAEQRSALNKSALDEGMLAKVGKEADEPIGPLFSESPEIAPAPVSEAAPVSSPASAPAEMAANIVEPDEPARLKSVFGADGAMLSNPELFQPETDMLAKGAATRAKTADAAEAAAQRQGVPLFPTALSSDALPRDTYVSLSKNPTVAGQKAAKEIDATYRALDETAARIVGTAPEAEAARMSRNVAGLEAKQAIKEKIEEFRSLFGKGYGELNDVTGAFPISEDARLALAQSVEGNKLMQLETLKGEAGKLKAIVNDALKADTVESLNQIKTTVGNSLSEAHRAGNYNLVEMLSPVDKALKDMREQAIEAGLAKMKETGGTAMEQAARLSGRRAELDSQYKSFKEFIKQIAQEAKLGNIKDQAKLLAKVESIDPATLTQRLFDVKNARGLSFVRENMPEVFDKLRRIKLNEIAEKSVKDGKYQLGTLLRQVRDLTPEAKAALFTPTQRRSLEDLRVIFERLPKDPNPSGTAHTLALHDMFSIDGVLRQGKDALSYAALTGKEDGAIGYVAKRMKDAQHKLESIPEVLNSLGDKATKNSSKHIGALTQIAEAMNSRHGAEKLSDEVAKLTGNVETVANRISDVTGALQHLGAPKTADALSLKLANAIKLISEEIPKSQKAANPLNPQKFRPSDAAIHAFERRLQVLMDPGSVIDMLKNGTLQKDHVDTLKAVYPKYYQAIQYRIMDHIASDPKPMPYPARLRLSVLMGVPLDESLTQRAIQDFQAAHQHKDAAPPQPQNVKLNMAGQLAPQSIGTRGRR